MAASKKKNETEQSIKAIGCVGAVLAVLIVGGCQALLGGDDKPTVSSRPLPTATPAPTPDKAATSACTNSVAANVLRVAGKESRAKVFDGRAVGFAQRSAVPGLRVVGSGEEGSWDVFAWCGVNLPDIDDDTVDRLMPSFRKEHDRLRAEAKKRSGGGSGGGGGGGGINLPGRW